MQWSLTVSDLVGRLEQQERAQIQGAAADLYEAETARTTLCERLRGQPEAPVRVRLQGGLVVSGRVTDAVPEWFVIAPAPAEAVLVAAGAVVSIHGLRARGGPSPSPLEARLGLSHALRRVASARTPVTVGLTDGGRVEGSLLRVGADQLDLRTHPADEPTAGTAVLTVAFSAVAVVASDPLP